MQFETPPSYTQISIGIQARSTSKRFPRKIFALLGEKMIIQHVFDACENSVRYINRQGFRSKLNVSAHILAPAGDEVGEVYPGKVIEGDEFDVLQRYVLLQKQTNADFVVRVTADCPLIPSYMISKAINIAVKNNYDYCSNVHEGVRTSVDGFDVEVISKRALEWLDKNSTTKDEREHVTLAWRQKEIPWEFSTAHMLGQLNLSGIKLSVDTKEDLEKVREEYLKVKSAVEWVEKLPGKNHIYRY